MSRRDVVSFLNRANCDRCLRVKLALLQQGDWQGAVRLAATEGFTFTEAELQAELPDMLPNGSNGSAGRRPR